MTPISVVTIGFQGLLETDPENVEEFMLKASARIKGRCDMVIGDPEARQVSLEDDGRTTRIPTRLSQKVYAVVNETGGITYMLPEEY